MKKTLVALCALLISNIIFGQNVPDGSTFSGTVANPTISMPAPYSLGSSPLFNYVRTFEPQYAQTNEASVTEAASATLTNITTTYMNGFGSPLQTIHWKVANSGTRDIIVPFDNRLSPHRFSFLPYVTSSAGNTFQTSPYVDQVAYYTGMFPDDAGLAMSESSYTSTSGNRTTVSYAPGTAGIGYMKGTSTTQSTNLTNEVIIWKINGTTGWPQKVGYYTAGKLSKKIVSNSDGAQVAEYYDNEGKLIARSQKASVTDCNRLSSTVTSAEPLGGHTYLPVTTYPYSANEETFHLGREVYINEIDGPNEVPYGQGQESEPLEASTVQNASLWLPQYYPVPFANSFRIRIPPADKCPTYILTYYVYDMYDRYTYTLHPKAVEYLAANAWVPTANIVDNLCDYYVFDELSRTVEKHVAGENNNEEIIYDSHGRVVLIRKPSEATWHWRHYDKLGRVIQTGKWTDSRTRSTLQSYFDNGTLPTADNTTSSLLYYLFQENMQGARIGVALTTCEFYTENFYDDYDGFAYYDGSTTHTMSFSYDNSIFSGHMSSTLSSVLPPTTASSKTKGMLTCSVKKVLKPGALPALANYVEVANFYDDRGRRVQFRRNNALGGQDVCGTQFDFKGRILTEINKWNNPLCTAQPNTETITDYYYNGYTQSLAST